MNSKIVLNVSLLVVLLLPLACRGQKASSPANAPSPPSSSTKPAEPISAPSPATANPSSLSADPEVGKWMDGMASVLPSIFCKDKAYFRECFKVTAQECETEAIRVTRVCLQSKKADIEANLKKDGGKAWGEKVGECAGQAYEISFKDKRIDTPKCNDVSQWL